jgi:GH15 family glucan-1,4-alpha-glucosidase
MGRPVMLGNGSLTVGLNEQGLVHDFYYPYVGLDNLTTSRSAHHKIGVWIEGVFSWVDDDTWDITVDFDDDALISTVRMVNKKLKVELDFRDFVDSEVNAFCRQCTVTNHAPKKREIRLFMHQVFQISRAGRGDTALFVPEDNYILDYKGRCSLLIYAQNQQGQLYDQFAIGNYGIEDKEGTFRDAEDGELSGSSIEHGGVDSVMRFVCQLEAEQQDVVDYWVIAADSQLSAEKIHNQFKGQGLSERLANTRRYWHEWFAIGANKLHAIDQEYLTSVKKSMMVIKAHTDKRGGIIASCDSSIYNYGRDYYSYVWPRDGAFVMWPLIRLGYHEEAQKFFAFCRDTMNPDGYMMHKYQPDRAIGSTWHPMLHGHRRELAIQEDETAIIIYMLGEYYAHIEDEDFVRGLYETLIKPAADFMHDFVDKTTGLPHASYDLWEEKFLTNTYTVALTYQALLVAADFAEMFEYPDDDVKWRQAAESILANSKVLFDPERQLHRKGYLLQEDGSLAFDNVLDVSSLYGVMMFGLHDTDKSDLLATAKAIEDILLDQSPSGGAPRYENDQYFASDPPHLGNPWFVTTLWMAQYYVSIQQPVKARKIVAWALKNALPSGVFSEQLNPTDSTPLSVAPLVWSHAELINTVLDLSKVV